MSDIPAELRYTKSHEWVRTLPDGSVEIGITDHAQHALGDLVFVDVPQAGRQLGAGDACAVVESVKAASDVYSPLAGEVIAGNEELAAQPELINQDPYGRGWILRLKPSAGGAAAAGLLDAAGYAAAVAAAG
jgi:glycine cleavage system H protein